MPQSLAIGLTSYDGGLYVGFTVDRYAMPDVEVLAGLVAESLGAAGYGAPVSVIGRPLARRGLVLGAGEDAAAAGAVDEDPAGSDVGANAG